MKIYYKEPDMYPGTYNFREEVDGTSGTDIDFVDSVSGTCTAIIVASDNGHRKVMKWGGATLNDSAIFTP